ncbi:aquaporin-7-like isoform X2 [Ornithodoros turicata]|uniref:aquaporin-7-like isoform X2 n=1 Tax=Ornithodoros turicata TaxID=34597 RepID=UPI00313A3DF4
MILDKVKVKSTAVREMLAELLGTFVLVLFGTGVLAALKFDKTGNIGYAVGFWGWGLALALAVLVAGGASGAHLNPSITIAMATIGKCQWKKVVHYMVAQYLGAFLGAAVLFCTYKNAFDHFDGGLRATTGVNATADVFASYPREFVSTGNCFLDQVVGTGLFVMCIVAITDSSNMAVPQGLQPLLIGISLATTALCFGYNCGAPLNPARDLGPRIFTAMAGWGTEVFSFRDYNWFWVPVVAPHIGAVVGTWLYKLLVGLHWPQDSYDMDQGRRDKDGTNGVQMTGIKPYDSKLPYEDFRKTNGAQGSTQY